MPEKWCDNCQAYKTVSYSSTTLCPSCARYTLCSSALTQKSYSNKVSSTARSIVSAVESSGSDVRELEAKIEQGNKYTGDYCNTTIIARKK